MAWTAPDLGTPQGIMQLGNGFCQAQVLLTAVELDLFTVLHDDAATETDIRSRLGIHGRGLRDCLRLLVALGLLEDDSGRYRNSPGSGRYLVRGQPGYIGGLLLGAKANLYPVWAGLTQTLRTGKPRSSADGFAAMLDDPDELRRYVRMMEGALQPLVPGLIEAIDWSAYRSVLDVGGCRGSLAAQLVSAHAGLAGHVLDLPQLRPLFDERMAELGTAASVRFRAGDFFRGPLPRADVLILGHILHNWPADRREFLVGQAFAAVSPGGVLLVHDRMLDDDGTSIDNLVASLIMALVTEEGAEYPVGELTDMAVAAGFASVTRKQLDENETLLLCHKAS